ncbi:MAG: HlyD family secretion protein [Acidobacteriaceae bacterium]|nr:HlyD family secretion protein [Acidobacteriaceae bacterium]MBV9780562.1 HlyD family secretion protein [Acidobacteriaceae bacterium]
MADHVEQIEEQDQQASQREENRSPSRADVEAERRHSNPRRKRTIRFIVLAILVVALIVSIPIYAYYSVRESTDDAQVDGHVVPISPRIAGTIIAVLVNDNHPVKAGQELVRLDPTDYQLAYDQAEAQLAVAEAAVAESSVNVPLTSINTRGQVRTTTTEADQYVAGVASAQQAVDAARARLNSANATLTEKQANYLKAQKDLGRMKDLVEKDEISRQEYDAAVAAADANAAQVESAKADVVEAQHNLDQAIAEVQQARARLATAVEQRRLSEQVKPEQEAVSAARYKQAQAQVQQRQADLNQNKQNLEYTIIKAPVDGVVSRKNAEPGMQVSPGQQIMELVPLDDVWVTANFKETQLRKMRVGESVEIEVDTYGSGRKYRGHIDSIAAVSGARVSLLPPENATGNYVKVVQRVPVKIVLEPGEDRDHRLLPGMSVVPTVLLNSGGGK